MRTALFLCLLPLVLSAAEPVIFGILERDAEKHDVEFQHYDSLKKELKAVGIEALLAPIESVTQGGWTEERIYQRLKACHVVALSPHPEGFHQLNDELRDRAAMVGRALHRYVSEGGGLFLNLRGVRYPGDEDEKYWNLVIAPLGLELLHEGTFDKSREFKAVRGRATDLAPYWYTQNITPHPITEGIGRLVLPLYDFGHWPGLPACRYDDSWQVIVRGEAEAGSFKSGVVDNIVNLDDPGTYASAPPVVAVRTLGKGRILSYPLTPIHWRLNINNPLWAETVERSGDPGRGLRSDSQQLIVNGIKWLGEPAQAEPGFGTHAFVPYEPIRYPPRVEWDGRPYSPPATTDQVRGIFGAISNHAGGAGTVAEYAASARAAGLAFVVFADPLEQLTPESLEQLKADCLAVSDETFYACPGLQFTTGVEMRWAIWGEKLIFPQETKESPGKPFVYKQWENGRINHRGWYAADCGFPGTALLDYRELRDKGGHPENLWWFYHYLPWVYDRDQLAADNQRDYLDGLADLRWAALTSYTRITSPADVALAAATCWTAFADLEAARKGLNTRCAAYWQALGGRQYVSQGPVITAWQVVNNQMEENWRYTRGGQRVQLRFAVTSPAGIREVIVHDANEGPIRRYLGHGAAELSREFEVVHDKQHWLALEVIDGDGKRAWSWNILVYAYKGGLFRCGDNLNILGPTGILWHPDRSEMFPMTKMLQNAEKYSLQGWDRGGPMCPLPELGSRQLVNVAGRGWYPTREREYAYVGNVMKVHMSSHNIHLASMRLDFLAQMHDTPERPGPALASIPLDLGPTDYFARNHTMHAFTSRKDMYTTWNHRRWHEGFQNYRGGLLYHEGEFRIKEDFTLGQTPGFLMMDMRVPVEVDRGWGTTAIATDADGSTKVVTWDGTAKRLQAAGDVRPGGYVAWLPNLAGFHAVMLPHDATLSYSMDLPRSISIGIGRQGQEFKAGDVIKYRFAVANFADARDGNRLAEHHCRILNLAGGSDGYPYTMKAGQLTDATVYFTAAAEDGEAAMSIGPVPDLVLDLPIRVTGLENNGCAAVHTRRRPWFRFIPVVGDTAYVQEDVDQSNDIWVGNIFRCDRPEVKLTVVADGQADGVPPRVEVHNPTDAALRAVLHSPAGTPVFGGKTATVDVAAGASVWLRLDADGALEIMP